MYTFIHGSEQKIENIVDDGTTTTSNEETKATPIVLKFLLLNSL